MVNRNKVLELRGYEDYGGLRLAWITELRFLRRSDRDSIYFPYMIFDCDGYPRVTAQLL